MPFGRHDLVPDPRRPYTQGGDTDTRQSGVYGQLRLRAAEPLTIVLGGRWSWYKTRSRSNWPATPTPWEAGGERVSGHFTPYAAVLYDINPVWTAYASFSDIFAPQDEQTVSGETLKPREGRQFELGAKAGFMDGCLLLTAWCVWMSTPTWGSRWRLTHHHVLPTLTRMRARVNSRT